MKSEAVRLTSTLRPAIATAKGASKVSQVPLGVGGKVCSKSINPTSGQHGDYPSALPKRFGTTSRSSTVCGGDSRKLKAVQALKGRVARQHPRLAAVVDVCHDVRRDGVAYRHEWLTVGGRGASSDSAAGGGGGGDGSSGGGGGGDVPNGGAGDDGGGQGVGTEGGADSTTADLLALDNKIDLLTARLAAVNTKMEGLSQRMWHATHSGDPEARSQLERAWFNHRNVAKRLESTIEQGRVRKLRMQRDAAEAAREAEAAAGVAQGEEELEEEEEDDEEEAAEEGDPGESRDDGAPEWELDDDEAADAWDVHSEDGG